MTGTRRLCVDPADGTLYAATHYGTFRLAGDGKAERVGESFQDTPLYYQDRP
jgi:hypothetical protein